MGQGFEGFVNPGQPSSLRYGEKKNKVLALPGQPVSLSQREMDKLVKKGLHKVLLVKSLPKVVGGEAPDGSDESDFSDVVPGNGTEEPVTLDPDDFPDGYDDLTKDGLKDLLDRAEIAYEESWTKGELQDKVAELYETFAV